MKDIKLNSSYSIGLDKPCFIDDDDHFKFDHKKMHKLYEAAVEKISGLEV